MVLATLLDNLVYCDIVRGSRSS